MTALGGNIHGDEKEGYHAFKDNGAKILAVAHCDNVHRAEWFASDKDVIFTSSLDDRLGVYTILDYLPSLGEVAYDILLTMGEESAKTTAANFKTEKQYNWLVEFDRRGANAVLYDYAGNGFGEIVEQFFPVDYGTSSDIDKLQFLKAKALNIGVGYHDEHAVNAYMRISEYLLQMARFLRFWRAHKDTFFAHEEKKYTPASFYDGEGWGWGDCFGRLPAYNKQNWDDWGYNGRRRYNGEEHPTQSNLAWVDGQGWMNKTLAERFKDNNDKINGNLVWMAKLGWVTPSVAEAVKRCETEAAKRWHDKLGDAGKGTAVVPVSEQSVEHLSKHIEAEEFEQPNTDLPEMCIKCPCCDEQLILDESEFGIELQCPYCNGIFVAQAEDTEVVMNCELCGCKYFPSQSIRTLAGFLCPDCSVDNAI